jgi:hypothetical protein
MSEPIIIEDLEKYKESGYLTVRRLKKILDKMPDDGLILIQRVKDIYYDNHGWGVVKKIGENYHTSKSLSVRAKSGEFDDTEKYPEMTEETRNALKVISDEELDVLKEQYHPAWCYAIYPDDDKNVYIDLHY